MWCCPPFRYDIVVAGKDGEHLETRFWTATCSAGPETGVRKYLVYHVRDVTGEVLTSGVTEYDEARMFRLVLCAVKDYAIFLMDADGFIRSWNIGAKRVKGWDASEVLGKHFSIFFTDEDITNKKPWKALESATEHGTVEDESWRKRKDGTLFWASVTITALHDESGALVGFV